jgi:hypothetical protein
MHELPPTMPGVRVPGLPDGYSYRVTRYADVILKEAFPRHFEDLVGTLSDFRISRPEIELGGGNRTSIVTRFDGALKDRGWGKESVDIQTEINGEVVAAVRSHEIDMFKLGPDGTFPGVAVETEWNNKDPFFDRDLSAFYTLNRAGALAVGVIVTRGPDLQGKLSALHLGTSAQKYGASTTHWGKLMPRVDVGGGGECPLFLVGIEPERVFWD